MMPQITEFRTSLRRLLEENKTITTDFILNMDETPVYIDMPYKATLEIKGTNPIRIKSSNQSNQRFTVVLTVSASGKKLKPLVVLSGKRKPKIDLSNGRNVLVTKTPKAWLNLDVMKLWISEVLVPWCSQNKVTIRNPKCILILDTYTVHNATEIKNLLLLAGVLPVFVPGGCTPYLQPLDVAVNKSFKGFLRLTQAKQRLERNDRNLKPKRPTDAELLDWIEESWNLITSDSIRNGFLTSGITTS